MFWNRSKEKTKNNSHSSAISKNQTQRKEKTLPLSFLKRLIPLSHLPDTKLRQLKITLSKYEPGDIIFNHSETSDSLLYLIKGQCFLETSNGSGMEINASTFSALYPLSNNNIHQTTAIAKSDVNIIHFSKKVLQQSNTNSHNPLMHKKDIPDHLQKNNFFKLFLGYYQQGNLIIPSLPHVALELRSAMQKDIGTQEAVSIVNLDPVISSKLIQVVNSPLYKAVTPITTCHDAITRLGLSTTRNLVTSISMQNLFKSSNKLLNRYVLALWKQSIHISCISHTLATLTEKVNPDEALLAGLIHNIGSLPIIMFADSLNDDQYTEQELTETISTLQSTIGNLVLKDWGFPDSLKNIPIESENWYFCNENTSEMALNDCVILAKLHSLMGSKQTTPLPPLHTLPAFQKLGDNALTPDMSLQILHDAKQQITDAMNLF